MIATLLADRPSCEQIAAAYADRPRQNIWEWARDNIDYTLAPEYPIAKPGPYDPDFIPCWREVVETITDDDYDQTWILKPSQSGGTENVLLNAERYHIAEDPCPQLYVTAGQEFCEEQVTERCIPGLKCSQPTKDKLKLASQRGPQLYFPDGMLINTWATSKVGKKGRPFKRIYLDEVSLFKRGTVDVFKARGDTYPFSHVVGLSSLDAEQEIPTEEDAIWIELEQTGRRRWTCLDPETGNPFMWGLGTRDSTAGIKWDQKAKKDDGSWDLDMVEETAYFVTPDGTRIENKDRMRINRETGHWVSTCPEKEGNKRAGFIVVAPDLPFKSGDFGYLAKGHLDANEKGPKYLRVYIYENWCEAWARSIESTKDERIYSCQANYSKASRPSEGKPFEIWIPKPKAVMIGADVQKGNLWAVCREFIEGGDSGLIEYRDLSGFEALAAFGDEWDASRIAVDIGYRDRRLETYQACTELNMVPVKGDANIHMPFRKQHIDPLEGTTGQGKAGKLMQLVFNSPLFKDLLFDMIRGESEKGWHLYRGIERDYVRQLTAEEKVDGVYRVKRGRQDNHLLDCEVYALLAAAYDGLYTAHFVTS